MRVVPLFQSNAAVMALLKSLLRQAEAGEIVSLIYSAEIAGGHVQAGYTDIEDVYSTLGQLERMKALLLRSLDDTTQEMDLRE
ncbi:MAG: hypothetical protein F9K25_10125 [Candidatus Contendobacter sp.]|nr:MAG: hypothetical protein F9K25_10125 [Candidatus Contendobacter sp.]